MTAARMPPGVVVCAVGDVHGRLDLLEPALEALFHIRQQSWEAGKSFAALLLGDYIDRGPDSRGVLSRLAALADSEEGRGFVFLRGNHEQELLDLVDGRTLSRRWLDFGGVETLNSYCHGRGEPFVMDPDANLAELIKRVVPSDHIRFLRRTQLFVVHGGYAFVHAGLNPDAPLDGQTTDDMLWRRAVSDETPRHGMTVVHGHSIHQCPVISRWEIGIDTGAFATGALSILRLEGADRTLIKVSRSGADARALVGSWNDESLAAGGVPDAGSGMAAASAPSPVDAASARAGRRRRVAVFGLLLALAMGAVSLLILHRGQGPTPIAGVPTMRLETLQLLPGPPWHNPGSAHGPPRAVEPAVPVAAAVATAAGRPVVELGAFASEADARAFAAELRSRMPGELKDRQFESRTGVADAPTLVHGFLAGFASADEARAFCARLGAQGRACWIDEVSDPRHPAGPGAPSAR
jgi:serine/threonine protein phosphatase 1